MAIYKIILELDRNKNFESDAIEFLVPGRFWISEKVSYSDLESVAAKRMKIGQYCQRQRCKHVELEQFLACFRVVRVCQ